MPTLRERKRYMVFQIDTMNQLDFKPVSKILWDSSLDFIGSLGVAEAGLWILPIDWDNNLQSGILKVNNQYVDKLRVSLSLINEINGAPARVNTLLTTGTLKKARKFTKDTNFESLLQ